MRAFIAINLVPEVKNNIISLMNECRKLQNKFIKYVEEENLHLTLKFLGDVKPEILTQLGKELGNIKVRPFEMKIYGAGAFPNVFFPKVIWAGIEENNGLNELFENIESAAFQCGFAGEERKFHPHITIARVNGNAAKELTDFLKVNKNRDMGVSKAGELTLYQSQLTPDGPVYTRLANIPLE
jgi:RNA 2',3'-cyclic 3'-phosphodiesterase